MNSTNSEEQARPPGTDDTGQINSPAQEPRWAARWGEKLLGFGNLFSRPASLLSRQEAAIEGVSSVVVRVIASAAILFLCYLLSSLYGAFSEVFVENSGGGLSSSGNKLTEEDIKRMLYGEPRPDPFFDPTLMFVLWMVVTGAAMVIFWVEWDRKWRVLHWLLFASVATLTLRWWEGSVFIQLAALTGQFGVHWLIHEALRERDRREEFEQEAAAAQRREERVSERRLQEKYRGLANFPAGDETKDG